MAEFGGGPCIGTEKGILLSDQGFRRDKNVPGPNRQGTRAGHRMAADMRLDAIPGVGRMLATALVVCVADPKVFQSGRNFSAWIGLVPKQHSSGGKDRLGSISHAKIRNHRRI
jgi:transposase